MLVSSVEGWSGRGHNPALLEPSMKDPCERALHCVLPPGLSQNSILLSTRLLIEALQMGMMLVRISLRVLMTLARDRSLVMTAGYGAHMCTHPSRLCLP